MMDGRPMHVKQTINSSSSREFVITLTLSQQSHFFLTNSFDKYVKLFLKLEQEKDPDVFKMGNIGNTHVMLKKLNMRKRNFS